MEKSNKASLKIMLIHSFIYITCVYIYVICVYTYTFQSFLEGTKRFALEVVFNPHMVLICSAAHELWEFSNAVKIFPTSYRHNHGETPITFDGCIMVSNVNIDC